MLYLLNINVLIKIMKMYCKRYCKKEIIYIYKDRKELLIKRLHLLNIKVFL